MDTMLICYVLFNVLSKLCLIVHQEIADGVIPLMFMKEFAGLDPAPLPCDAVSFARFSIMSYIFCAEQIPDAIFGFIKMLKQKLAMTVEASIHSYSLDMLLKVMLEDLRPSAAGAILLESIERLGKEAELSLTSIVKCGIKYPILFYVFERFRKHMRRIVFGDKFWKGRPQMKLKMEDVPGSSAYFTHRFKDEATAMLETSRSIISDVVSVKKRLKVYRLSDRAAPEVMCLDEEDLQKLKDTFGYEKSRQLAVDSEIVMECDSTFVERAFGRDSPVRYPPRGVKVFPGSAPKGILDIPPEDEHDEEQQMRDEEGQEEDDENPEVGEGWFAEEEDSSRHDKKQTAAVASMSIEVEPQTDDDWEAGTAAAAAEAPPTPGGYMSSLPSTPHGAFPALPSGQHSAASTTPRLRQSASSMLLRMSVASFASFALSWGSRPTTAEVEVEPEPIQVDGESRIETIFDTQQGREFRFDPETGKSAWVRSVVDRDGDLVLEYCA